MKRLLLASAICIFGLLAQATPVAAAQFYGGNAESFAGNDTLRDAYIGANTVDINVPATGDLTAAGQTVNINSTIDQGLFAAGGTVIFNGEVKQSARLAGGDVTINGKIDHDLFVAGGTVNLSSSAQIDGDLIIAGGTVQINAPVAGRVYVYGGQVTINSKINGNLEGQMQSLTLGSKADIGGDVIYHSEQELARTAGAIIHGKTNFIHITQETQIKPANIAGQAIYGLVSSLLITLLLIYLFRAILPGMLAKVQTSPVKSLVWGASILVLTPIISLILIPLSVWLSIILMLCYGILILVSWFVAQIYLGYWILRWWHGRDRRLYNLDWQAGVIGAITTTILMLVPILGWLVMLVLWWLAFGSIAQYLKDQHTPSNALTTS